MQFWAADLWSLGAGGWGWLSFLPCFSGLAWGLGAGGGLGGWGGRWGDGGEIRGRWGEMGGR